MMMKHFMLLAFLNALVISPSIGAADEAPWEIGSTSPNWGSAVPVRLVPLRSDPEKSDEQNGTELVRAIERLRPGDMLEIGPGRYSIRQKFSLNLQGTSAKPIWIVGEDSRKPPIITRPDVRQNVMNVGERSTCAYLCLRNLELTGGHTLIRFYDCHHLWLDQCHLHHGGGEGITANSRDTSHLFITRNHFHHFTHPNATGEAMYLGGNHGKTVMSYSVIADNHVHDCAGTQGDGIELKQGSHHNWIFRNHVHDTKYPCIIAYGTDGHGKNMIEANLCYRSGDNVMQVQGEAVVRNNLLIAGAGAGFASTDHQGKTTRLEFVHNTIVSKRRGVNLSSWNDRQGMIFANNAVYTDQGDALRFPRGSRGVLVSGNIVVGRVSGVSQGFIAGDGLSDFVDVSWDGSRRGAIPSRTSRLLKEADLDHFQPFDLQGKRRSQPAAVGAFAATK